MTPRSFRLGTRWPETHQGDAPDASHALAAELVDGRGYANVTMEQLAVPVGIVKPTLHHYFRAKDEILRGIHEEFIGLLLDRQEERQRLELSPAGLLLGAMTDILGLMETHRGHVRVFEHYREVPDPVQEDIRVKRDRYQNMVRDAVAEGIRTGLFRGVDADIATLTVFGTCNWAYQWWRPGSGADPAYTARRMWDLIMRGMLAPDTGPAGALGRHSQDKGSL
jgi:TetR/AcrR family transcriptional regulator, cholesterol catabolism regulator